MNTEYAGHRVCRWLYVREELSLALKPKEEAVELKRKWETQAKFQIVQRDIIIGAQTPEQSL